MSERKSTPLCKDGAPSDRVEVPAAAPVEVPATAPVEDPVVAPMEDQVVAPEGVPAAASVGVDAEEKSTQLGEDIKKSWASAFKEFMEVGPAPLIYRGPIDRVEVPAAAPAEDPVVAPVEVPAAAPVEVPAAAPAGDSVVAPVEVQAAAPVEVPTAAPAGDSIVAPVEVQAAAPAGDSIVAPVEIQAAAPAGDSVVAPVEVLAAALVEVPAAAPAEDSVVAPVEVPAAAPVEIPAAAPAGDTVVAPVEVSAAAPESVIAEIQPPVKIRRVGDIPRLPINAAGGNVSPAIRENKNTIIGGSEQVVSDSDSVFRDFFARLPSAEVLEESGRKLDESIAGVQNMQHMVKNMCKTLKKSKHYMKSGAENAQKAGGVFNPANVDLSVCGTQMSNVTSLLGKVNAGITELPHLDSSASIQPPPPPVISEEEKERLARANAYARDHQLIRTGRSDSQNRYLTNLERVMQQEFDENVIRVMDNLDNDELPRHQSNYFNGLRERFSGSIDEHLLQGATLLATHESQVFTWDAYFLEDMEARSAAEHGESPETLIKDYLESVFFPRE